MPHPPLNTILQGLEASALSRGHRHILVITSCDATALPSSIAAQLPPDSAALWLTSAPLPPLGHTPIHPKRAADALGTECQRLIIDLTAPSSLEALGSVAGALKAGGVLLLLTPPLDSWLTTAPIGPEDIGEANIDPFEPPGTSQLPGAPPFGHAFLGRFIRCLKDAPGVSFLSWESGDITHNDAFLQGSPPQTHPISPKVPDDLGALTPDQRAATLAILKVYRGRRNRPLVLTADRGRGKSASLGLAAAQLMKEGPIHIKVVAPRPSAIQPLFASCRRALGITGTGWAISHGEATMTYRAPTTIDDPPTPVDLLFVDEAAALPVPFLKSLLKANGRAVFSTTLHGYEGTGQGFNIRFRRVLDQEAKNWRTCHLTAPIRWAAGDPLEAFIDDALLLNATAPALPEGLDGPPTLRLHTPGALSKDTPRLKAMVGLLIDAHYRTTPSDTHRLLDAPGVLTLSLEIDGHVVGAMVALPEGPIPEPLATEIYAGRRRLRGQLLPQSLITHLGCRGVAELRGVRIQRIAIHRAVQGKGLGTHFLREFAARLDAQGVDYLGTSFGATAPLLRFWEGGGFWPCRIGTTRGKSSGLPSAMLLRPISPQAKATLGPLQGAFKQRLVPLLGRGLRTLDPTTALTLLTLGEGEGTPGQNPGLESSIAEGDLEPLVAFAWGPRDGDMLPGPLHRLGEAALGCREGQALLGPTGCTYLLRATLQGKPWEDIAPGGGPLSQGQGKRTLAKAIQPIITAWGGENVAVLKAPFLA